jgi:hypothetical protein
MPPKKRPKLDADVIVLDDSTDEEIKIDEASSTGFKNFIR